MKKITVKQQLKNATDSINKLFYQVTEIVGPDKALDLWLAKLNKDLQCLDDQIDDEKAFADENLYGSYQSAGTEACQRIKHYKKIRKEHVKLINMFNQFATQWRKVSKLI